jgi:uncharacterized protein (TIGR04141 family)
VIRKRDKKNRLTIYLFKDGVTEDSGLTKPDAVKTEIPGFGNFYSQRSVITVPGWVSDFFGDNFPTEAHEIKVASAKGLLVMPASMENGVERWFGISFGHGRSLILEEMIEDRFGLKVVLNAVDSNTLRSIDKTSLGSTLKQTREQVSKLGGADSFGIDVEQDLLFSITGRSNQEPFTGVISGKDALNLSVPFNIKNVRELLKVCLEKYSSVAYRKEFDWVDQIQDVRNKTVISALDAKLIADLNAKNVQSTWIAPPEIIDWSAAKGFRYLRPKRGETFNDLSTDDYLSSLSKDLSDVADLKRQKIFLVSGVDDVIKESWPVYNCIYREDSLDGQTYILNRGKWYLVDAGFVARVNSDFQSISRYNEPLIPYTSAHKNEAEYNKDLARSFPDSVCLDANNISYGGGRSKIEFCDVMTLDKQLFHVKRYSGSSQLSHLFSQASVSAELFISDVNFREKLVAKLPTPNTFDPNIRPNASDYRIVLVIISQSKNPLDLPFFSKVTLRAARSKIEGFGYTLELAKVVNTSEEDALDDEVIE